MPAHACIYEAMEVRLKSLGQDDAGFGFGFGWEKERTCRVKQSAPGETLCLSQGIW